MYYIFLIKKPIVYVWLIAVYFIFYGLQYSLLHVFYSQGKSLPIWMAALVLTISFHRLFLYFCIGYFALIRTNHLSFRGIPLKVLEKPFRNGVLVYAILSFFTIFFTVLYAAGGYFVFTMSLMSAIYERVFLYAAKWAAIYHFAQNGVPLSQSDFNATIDEARSIFLSDFAKSEDH